MYDWDIISEHDLVGGFQLDCTDLVTKAEEESLVLSDSRWMTLVTVTPKVRLWG